MSIYGVLFLVALGGLYAVFAYAVIEDFFWRRKQRKFAAKQRPMDLTSPEGRERLGLDKERNPR